MLLQRGAPALLLLLLLALILSPQLTVRAAQPAPQLVLLGPSEIATCHQSSFFDSSASVVFNESHASYAWTVNGAPASPGAPESSLSGRRLSFPTPDLGDYLVELTVTDSLGRSASASRTVTKKSGEQAGLYVLHHAAVPATMPIYLLGRTDFSHQPCDSVYSYPATFKYTWDFVADLNGMVQVPMDAGELTATDRLTQLVLPAGFAPPAPGLTLVTGLKANLQGTRDPRCATAPGCFHAPSSATGTEFRWRTSSVPLEPRVAGGQTQVFFEHQVIALDGSVSRDPDFPEGSALEPSAGNFSHSWRAFRGSGADQVEISDELADAGVALNRAFLVIPRRTLAWGDYWFELKFRSEAGAAMFVPPREATAAPVHVQVLPEPQHALGSENAEPRTFRVSGDYFLGSNTQPLRMLVQRVDADPVSGNVSYRSVSVNDRLAIAWSEVRQGLQLEGNPDVVSLPNTPTLTILPHALRPHTPYRVRVELSDWLTGALLQEMELEFEVNAPPTPGRCWVVNPDYRSLDHFLHLECSDFWDELPGESEADPPSAGHLPLLYRFSMRFPEAGPGDPLGNWTMITGLMPTPHARLLLPPGTLEFRVTVRDALGAESSLDFGRTEVRNFTRAKLDLVSGAHHNYTFSTEESEELECVLHSLLWVNTDISRMMGDVDLSLQLVSTGVAIVRENVELLSSRDPDIPQAGWCAPDHYPPVTDFYANYTVREWQVVVINEIAKAMITVFDQTEVAPEMASQMITQTVSAMNALMSVPGNRFSDGLTPEAARDLLEGVQKYMDPESIQIVLVIFSAQLETVNCSHFDDVAATIRLLSQRTLDGVLPDEEAKQGSANGVDYSATRTYGGQNSSVQLDSDQMRFDLMRYDDGTFGSAEEFVDVTVIRFNENSRRCRAGAVGNVVDIKFGYGGQANGSSVNGQFVFDLPLDHEVGEANIGRDYSTAQSCSDRSAFPVCGWWEPDALSEEDRWHTSGCSVEGRFPIRKLDNGRYVLRCHCEHLTEFAALMRVRHGSLCEEAPKNQVYVSFVGFYFVLAALAAIQCLRILYAESDRGRARNHNGGCGLFARCSSVLVQHGMITLAALFRGLSCVALSGYVSWELEAVGVLSALPYLFVFFVYTLLIFQWMGILYAPLKGTDEIFRRFRPVFIGANVAASLMIVILCLSIVTDMSDSPEDVAMAGSIVVCLMVLVTGSGFLLYGYRIARALDNNKWAQHRQSGARGGGGSASASVPSSPKLCGCVPSGDMSVSMKMKLSGLTVFTLFLIEAVLWVYSAARVKMGEAEDDASIAVFLACDLLALVVIMLLYRPAVRRLVEQHHERLTAADSFVSGASQGGDSVSKPRKTPSKRSGNGKSSSRKGEREKPRHARMKREEDAVAIEEEQSGSENEEEGAVALV